MEKYDALIQTRLTKSQLKAFKDVARKNGFTAAAFLRWIVLVELGLTKRRERNGQRAESKQ